jgi:hypothetical protein
MEPNFYDLPYQEQVASSEEPENDKTDRENFTSQLIVEVENSSGKQFGIADGMKVDESTISKWKDSRPGLPVMPAWRLVRWTKKVGPGLLRWIACQSGYDLVPHNRVAPCRPPKVERLVATFARHAGAAVGQTLDNIASDGVWTEKEKANDLALWLKIQHYVNNIVEGVQRDTAGRRV